MENSILVRERQVYFLFSQKNLFSKMEAFFFSFNENFSIRAQENSSIHFSRMKFSNSRAFFSKHRLRIISLQKEKFLSTNSSTLALLTWTNLLSYRIIHGAIRVYYLKRIAVLDAFQILKLLPILFFSLMF